MSKALPGTGSHTASKAILKLEILIYSKFFVKDRKLAGEVAVRTIPTQTTVDQSWVRSRVFARAGIVPRGTLSGRHC